MGQRIGIMGGTFNPIHNGHLLLAEMAYEEYQLDKILFLPNKHPGYKDIKQLAKEEYRIEMVKLAIEDNSHFALSMIECERSGITYTVDTLRQYHAMFPQDKVFFIMGADSLTTLEKWKEPEIILSLATLLVAARDEKGINDLKIEIINWKKRFNCDIRILSIPQFDIASHTIRERILQGQSIRYLLPDCVENYIREQHLYELRNKE